MKRGRVGFLKPKEDDDLPGYQEDRPDLDTNSQTSFVYNPHQNQDLERQRARLPIAAYRDNLLYLLENHQVFSFGNRYCNTYVSILHSVHL